MAKQMNDLFADAAFDWLSGSVTLIWAVSGSVAPADYAHVTSASCASIGVAGSALAKDDGDTNGRKVTVPARAGASITTTGDATHVCLTSADTLLYVTTCTLQTLTSGGTVDFPAWDIEIADPT
jgi:hypothetical protein